jgi:hypothetical protein
MRFSKMVVVALIALFVLAQAGVPASAHDGAGKKDAKPKQQQSMKEDFKDIGKAVKKDSKTAGHEIKNGFKDMGSEVKGMFKKK